MRQCAASSSACFRWVERSAMLWLAVLGGWAWDCAETHAAFSTPLELSTPLNLQPALLPAGCPSSAVWIQAAAPLEPSAGELVRTS